MFYILTAVLILGPRGHSDGLPITVDLNCEPSIGTISYEVLMARIAALMERPLTDHRKPQEAGNDQGRDASPNGDALMERILGNMNATPQEEVLKRIASLPRTRRDKVLDIRRQIVEGTYEVADRLEGTVDRILDAITA
ncbi:MAG: flagellar biosynthesis anti-sigma factor FlgM [Phycisphaerales bacterium]